MPQASKKALVVGATVGIGQALAAYLADHGASVTLTSRDRSRAQAAAAGLGEGHDGIALDLARPETIEDALSTIDRVDHLALVGSVRDRNSLADYDIARGIDAVTAKLVGYTAVIKALMPRFSEDASIVVMGGAARKAAYQGSLSYGLVNGGVTAMVKTYARQLHPVRINAVHPGAVEDTPTLENAPPAFLDVVRSATASRRLVRTADIAHAIKFLFDNPGVNGINLEVDGGFPVL